MWKGKAAWLPVCVVVPDWWVSVSALAVCVVTPRVGGVARLGCANCRIWRALELVAAKKEVAKGLRRAGCQLRGSVCIVRSGAKPVPLAELSVSLTQIST